MKKIIIVTLSTAMLLNSSGIKVVPKSEIETQSVKRVISIAPISSTSNLTKVKIKRDGKIKNMLIFEDRNLSQISTQSTILTKLNSKDGLIIEFNTKDIDIDSFATLFNIKLKEKLKIGYYIFKNSSNLTDINLINAILEWDKNNQIKEILPNWKMEMKSY